MPTMDEFQDIWSTARPFRNVTSTSATYGYDSGSPIEMPMGDGGIAVFNPITGGWTRRASGSSTQPSQLTRFRTDEKQRLEQFIKTGSSELEKFTNDDGVLHVKGYNIAGTNILFTLDDEAITAPKSRTRHLKTLLTKLAQREGLELRLVDEAISSPSGPLRQVVFWAFRNPEDVDDTELVMANKPARNSMSSNPVEDHDYDGDVADDCDCPECMGDDDEDEDDDGDFPF